MFNHQELKVYFRDSFVDFKDATLSVSNTGFMYGLGVFTGMRAHRNPATGKIYIFRPEDHYKRLHFQCRMCHFENFLKDYSCEKFCSILLELIRVNKMQEDVYIRVTNFSDENRISPRFIGYKDALTVFLYPLGDYVPLTGMRCVVSSWSRIEDNAIPARGKLMGAYINTSFAKTEALRGGFDEAIVLDSRGHVVEGSAENIFLLIDGKIVTPAVSDNILEGITRRSVIEIAKNEGFEVVERSVDRTELYKADEIFLTGTGARVAPVIEIDHRAVGGGKVGPVAEKIRDIYARATIGEDSRYSKWLLQV